MVLKELTKVPVEFIPFIFEQIKAYNKGLKGKKIKWKSPAKRLMDLAGALENPEHLNAKQYKKKIVDEFLLPEYLLPYLDATLFFSPSEF